jgi:hypothetical protein
MVATINARVRLADTIIQIAKVGPAKADATATDLRFTGVTASSAKKAGLRFLSR